MTIKEKKIIEIVDKALKESERMWETKEQSDAYIIGYLQGTLRGIRGWEEANFGKGDIE